jgi:hypothetical protein
LAGFEAWIGGFGYAEPRSKPRITEFRARIGGFFALD